jgi:hypothetical protein
VTREICFDCHYRLDPPAEYRVFPPPPGRYATVPCGFLGKTVGLRPCPICRGTVQVKVFACQHPRHAETTLAECAYCSDFDAGPSQSTAEPGP